MTQKLRKILKKIFNNEFYIGSYNYTWEYNVLFRHITSQIYTSPILFFSLNYIKNMLPKKENKWKKQAIKRWQGIQQKAKDPNNRRKLNNLKDI